MQVVKDVVHPPPVFAPSMEAFPELVSVNDCGKVELPTGVLPVKVRREALRLAIGTAVACPVPVTVICAGLPLVPV